MDRKLQRHRADSLRQHGFLVVKVIAENVVTCFLGGHGVGARSHARHEPHLCSPKFSLEYALNKNGVGKTSYFRAKCVTLSKTEGRYVQSYY